MNEQYISHLQQAYKQKKITMYLGAGVSVANGLPSWEQLVVAMYFSIIGKQKMEGWRPLSNYLFAISQWYLSKLNQPLDITMRKLQKYFKNSPNGEQEFLNTLYQTLYSGILENNTDAVDSHFLRRTNGTLDAVAKLCEISGPTHGIKNVITYNYDDFLEVALKSYNYQTVYKNCELMPDSLPIYHVHGYMPIRRELAPKTTKDLVFTEYQYNKVATNPNHWSNKIQMQSMSQSVGIMIGLSLADRNMRRLLYTLRDKSIQACNYILLKRTRVDIEDNDLDDIHEQAIKYYDNFREGHHDFSSSVMSGGGRKAAKKKSSRPIAVKPPIARKSSAPTAPTSVKSSLLAKKSSAPTDFDSEPRYRYEIRSIIQKIEEFDWDQQEFVMNELGIKPIWYDNYEDIPNILGKIIS